eukprot:Gregarina_sp_Pseudo_9__5316@NODE_622_length_2475_cov_10_389163_g587_i0_p3_GENE_NODE_622_length_2475_cov_10_389163_g587_i0NODE_622_length_2475_cov_10_389163_g587_i0_p3_ORF_typecomplete_len129_score21_31_NODE_622_length_2475_cov_10_389163_g587_i0301687
MVIRPQSCLKPFNLVQTRQQPPSSSARCAEIDVALLRAFRRNAIGLSHGSPSTLTKRPRPSQATRRLQTTAGKSPTACKLVTANNSHVVLEHLTYPDIQRIMQDCSTNGLLLSVCEISGWLKTFSMTI